MLDPLDETSIDQPIRFHQLRLCPSALATNSKTRHKKNTRGGEPQAFTKPIINLNIFSSIHYNNEATSQILYDY